jgi:hypothetical protein
MIPPKCPECDKILTNVDFHETRIGPLFSTDGLRGIIYQCPYCQHVLGVGVDPVALKTDTVSGVADQIESSLAPILNLLQQIANRLNQMR